MEAKEAFLRNREAHEASGSALKAKTRNHVSAYFRPPMYVLKNHII
jgi:hypothetical protein